MILIVLAGLCVASVPLTQGKLSRLAELRLRCLWLAPLALAVQVVIVTIAPQGDHMLHAAIHIGTYALSGAFLWLNRKIPGAKIIAAGTLANALPIVANGGVMPASATAERLAGLTVSTGFHNSGVVMHPYLLWLGDNIPVPGPLPNVLSVGDCLIYAGMLVLLHRACRPAPPPEARSGAIAPAEARNVLKSTGVPQP